MTTLAPIYVTSAVLWDGRLQLSGQLELWAGEVRFCLDDFQHSHLGLSIPLGTIRRVEEYLVFDLARNGLKIEDQDGKYDLFVMEDAETFKFVLLEQIHQNVR